MTDCNNLNGLRRTCAAVGMGVLLAGSLLSNPAVRADAAPGSKSDRSVAHSIAAHPRTGWSSVIVRLSGDLNNSRKRQLQALGAHIYSRLPIIHSVGLRLPSRNLARLEKLPFVKHLSSDAPVKKNDEFTVGASGADVAYSQYGATGLGVGVAVVDSGIHTAKDFSTPGWWAWFSGPTRISANVSFVTGDKSTDDECGHGTHVAGIVAGGGDASTGSQYYRTFYGIARQAALINVRVLDNTGQGTVSQVISGIQWTIANRRKYNIRVLNLSLGHPVGESYTTDPLCQAVEQAWKSGIVVVCAAGNLGRLQNTVDPTLDNEGYGTSYGSIQSPGNDPYVITVGAMKAEGAGRLDDRIATYSSRGPSRGDLILKPDIVAPGNRIISVDADRSFLDLYAGGTNQIPLSSYCKYKSSDVSSNNYFLLSGTSMASPVVAGAAAMLLQANPNLTPDTVKARLMVSADKWADASGKSNPCVYGAGYLNIPAALKCAVTASQPAMSPSLSQDALGNVFINMDRAIWGTSLTDLRAIWGTRAIWGESTNVLDASRAIWGTSVWSDRAIWGTDTSAVDLTSTVLTGEN